MKYQLKVDHIVRYGASYSIVFLTGKIIKEKILGIIKEVEEVEIIHLTLN